MTDPRYEIAFPHLSTEQIDAIKAHAEVLPVSDGEYLWHVGDADFGCFIVIEGRIEIVEESDGVQSHIAFHDPGGFTGDVDLLSGRPSLVSAISRGPSQVVKLSPECLRKIVAERPDVGDTILMAFIMRRVLLLERGITGLRVIGSRFSVETQGIREFCSRNRVPYTWMDLESDDAVQETLKAFNVTAEETPVVLLPDGSILKNPTITELAERVGVRRALDRTVYDLLVVGAGPAGLAAAVYGSSEGLRTLLLDRMAPGGQAGASSKIENYLGFPTGLSGQELADRAQVQAEKFGTIMSVPTEVTKLECGDGDHMVVIDGDEELHARAVILATGAHYRKLDVPGYKELEMAGVYYAATGMEAQLCRGEDIAIVGAGNSAGQAAVYLSAFAKKVWMIVRGDGLEATMSTYLIRRIAGIENIEILVRSEVTAVHGEHSIDQIEVLDKVSQEKRCLSVLSLFVFIGAIPQTDWTSERLSLDDKGFVLTGTAVAKSEKWTLSRAPYFLETSCPGVFAVGDVRSGSIKRVASAVGEGSMAVAFVHEYLHGPAS